MKKIQWLIAALFIGMGLTCMTISAVSFQGNPLIQISGIIKMLACIIFIVFLCAVFMRKKH
ncbi:hypothetical protein [Paenibacillus sp. DMB5]|uniref:hypothetical protein n=1 Tax=Paenibacillus sp. DMB5 TaxID=1780103 RepID=UPI00076D8A5B|nr:hypothetical protein [Paenibacillus sp. DMB5]KUP23994.1 hypothetical protein AWJ19_10455 [Paenibacillus sp. DMB5]